MLKHIFYLLAPLLGTLIFNWYASIRRESGYVSSCLYIGERSPLNPLPVLNKRCESVSLSFVDLLPKDQGFDSILTMTVGRLTVWTLRYTLFRLTAT